MRRRSLPGVMAVLVLALMVSIPSEGRGDGPTDGPQPTTTQRRRPPRPAPRQRERAAEDARWRDPVTAQGQQALGLYLGASYVRRNGARGVIDEVRAAGMNAVVLDLKDSDGRIHHDTQVPELRAYRTGWLGDTAAVVRELREAGIYTIARVTCFADRRLPADQPERAILHTRRGTPWTSWGTGGTWLDPHHPENHRMIVELSREAQALGFDEVQLDYVRFPVDDGIEYARYPAQTEETHADVLMRLLRAVDEAITVPLAVDVFGLAAYRRGDPSGLGQDLERWTRHVEVFTPMLYINAMRAWNVGEPNRANTLIYGGVNALRDRIGPQPVIRPFLQAFSRGAGQPFNAEFIEQQIRGARRGRADGFLFWHPGHNYGTVRRAMRGGSRALVPFPVAESVRDARIASPRRRTPPPAGAATRRD